MKQLFKMEFQRAIKGRGMFVSLLIGMIISITHVIQYIIPAHQANGTKFFMDFPILIPNCSAEYWMAGNTNNLEGFLFFLLIPILACLPFGISYFEDCNSGFLKNLYMRTSRKDYLTIKYTVAFLAGGIAVVVPLMFNLICSLLLLPNVLPSVVLPISGVGVKVSFYTLFFSHPVLYICIYIFFDFLMAGIFACLGLTASFLTDYKIIVLICPFFIQLVIHVLCTILGKTEYSSVFWEQAGVGLANFWIAVVYVGIGFISTFLSLRAMGAL